jgi:general stress protein 26
MTTIDSRTDTESRTPDNVHARERFWELIKDIRFAMLTTRHANGHLHSRPMTTQNSRLANGHLHSRPMTTQNSRLDEDDTLWFFMSKSSDPLADLTDEPVVNVSYADPGRDAYVSVSGEAREVQDEAKKRQLWSTMAEAWFPGGVDDPDLALVRVSISHADYWETKDSKIVQLFKMAKAAAGGHTPSHMGERQRVDMH